MTLLGISAEQVLCLLLHLAIRYTPKTPSDSTLKVLSLSAATNFSEKSLDSQKVHKI